MHLPRSWLCVLVSVSSAACLRTTAFQCAQSSDCGGGGTCAAVGYCSFPDGTCASGARFGEAAGTYANQCVDGQQVVDAGVDDSPGVVDAPVDGPISVGCPAGYAAITGGQGNHLYRLAGAPAGATASWGAQRDFCAATSASAYLAIPDDATELEAIATLSASSLFWIGLTDAATEGTWLTVKGELPPFLNWANGQPDNSNPGEHCAAANATEMRDERCGNQVTLRAVCECEP